MQLSDFNVIYYRKLLQQSEGNRNTVMTSKRSQCSSCLRDGDVVTATHWCTDCSEPLCVVCNRYHKKTKATTKHKTITIESLSELSPAVLNLSYKCKIHPQQVFAFFCPAHDTLCCVRCVPEHHKQCNDLITLDSGANKVKSSEFLLSLEKRILDTKSKLSEVINRKESNISTVNDQRDKIQKEIGKIRKKIRDHFDKIEQQLYNDLNKAHESCTRTLDEGIKQIRERVKKMEVWHHDIATLKENASDVHVFAVIKTIGPLQNKQEAYLSTLQDELTKFNIEFIEEETWRHLISEVPSFGEVSVTEANNVKAKEYIRFKKNTLVENMNERIVRVPKSRKFMFSTLKLEKGTKIRSGCFLPDNKLLLSSFNENCVFVCNKDGEKRKKISLPFKLSDMTLYNKQQILFATGTKIQSFNTNSLTLGDIISESFLNDVISSSNDQVAIRSPSGAISVMDVHGKLLRQLQVQSYGYIALDRFGRVYYTNNAKSEVHCFYPNGSHKCIYRHENLKDPSGMTTDETGNLYVAGHLSHNIHKISAQGKESSIVLTYNDGIEHPQRITYNDKTGELLIINSEWKSVEIYQL